MGRRHPQRTPARHRAMRCQVTRRMLQGKPIDAAEVRALPPAVGDLRINDEMYQALGRTSKTASFRGVNSIGPSELPLLHEAVLSRMAPNGFVLSGLEQEGGCLYAQSWWCRNLG